MNSISTIMKTILSIVLLLTWSLTYGQGAASGVAQKSFNLDTNMILIIFAVFLLLPIWILSKTFMATANRFSTHKTKSGSIKVLLPFSLLLMSTSLMAQSPAQTSLPWLSSNGMTMLLLCVVAAELLLILFFARKTNDFIQRIDGKEELPAVNRDPFTWLKEKWTSSNFKPIEEEYKIDTGHSYDGIRELDNIIPPWFTTAFLITIVIGLGYLYRYHIAKSAPLQIEEFNIAMAAAELEHDEYLKTQANAVDENSVATMTGADLDAGKKTFVTLCAACHKPDGGGLVGPNLTDDYWLHGGSLKDLFKTVKYGYPDKGMISWKEQLSPVQIAQVTNYILTLKGSNPPDAKEKQGELYVAEAATPDSTGIKTTQSDTLTQ